VFNVGILVCTLPVTNIIS